MLERQIKADCEILSSIVRIELFNEKVVLNKRALSDDEVRTVLHRMIKQRKEVIASISGKGLLLDIAKEALEIMTLEKYMNEPTSSS
jgi:uncharacterized protein YqeY